MMFYINASFLMMPDNGELLIMSFIMLLSLVYLNACHFNRYRLVPVGKSCLQRVILLNHMLGSEDLYQSFLNHHCTIVYAHLLVVKFKFKGNHFTL